MKTLVFVVVGIVFLIAILGIYSFCKVASISDEKSEEIFKRKEAENENVL